MSKNTESVKQLLHLLKLVCHERDEARDQIQKLLNKDMTSINKSMIRDCFMIDQLHQHHQYPIIIKPATNSSIAESNSLSDHAYNHCSPVNSLFDPVTSPELSNINTNNSFVQDYHMLPNDFRAMHSPRIMNNETLMLENMIKGKALPQKGNLLKSVVEAGPLLQTLLAKNSLSPRYFEMSSGGFSQMISGGGSGSMLSFNDMKSSNYQGRMVGSCPMANNFGPVEKRQRFR
ncbi:hypothetical protein Hdeb2414_s0010g00358311 [Helianthus debilis subsp. tardiflorus]